MADRVHEPVLTAEAMALLAPERGGLFVDCTVGLGGHTQALLEAGASKVLGLDRDRDALRIAGERLTAFGERVELVHADYRDLPRVLDERGVAGVAGALADLGVSSMQLDAEGRGFSFRRDEPLDMRMDRSQGPTAADLLREAGEEELAERHLRARRRALFAAHRAGHRRRAPRRRRSRPPVSSRSWSRRAVPHRGYQRIDPATRTFQALRICGERRAGASSSASWAPPAPAAAPGGRLVVISFHSLEDRIVKHAFRALAQGRAALQVLTKRPIVPGDAEIERNPRARSAKLRAIERLA